MSLMTHSTFHVFLLIIGSRCVVRFLKAEGFLGELCLCEMFMSCHLVTS